MRACQIASRGPPMRMARGSSESFCSSLRILRTQQLVAAHARVVIDVPGLRHSDHGMNQQIRFNLLGCAEGEFHVGAVHRIAGLEGDNTAPSEASKFGAQFRRSEAQCTEIIMRRCLQTLDATAHVPRVGLVHRVVGAGMGFAGAVEYGLGFGRAVGLPDFFDVQHGEHHAFGVAQRNFAAAGRELLGKFFGDIERDRHRPKHTAGQAHVVANAFVVGFGHKAAQRRESSAHEQFQVANLAGG